MQDTLNTFTERFPLYMSPATAKRLLALSKLQNAERRARRNADSLLKSLRLVRGVA